MRKAQKLDRTIVRVIKATREDMDVSRTELAARLGWKRHQVVDLEIGRRILRASDLFHIARALKMEPDALVRRIQRW